MPLSGEAKRIAYDTGVRQLEPLAQRVIDLEAQVKTLTDRLSALESVPKCSAPVPLSVDALASETPLFTY